LPESSKNHHQQPKGHQQGMQKKFIDNQKAHC
jgi:hypothetical protein